MQALSQGPFRKGRVVRLRKTTRREFLTISAMAGVGLLLPVGCSLGGTSNEEQMSRPISGDTFRKFAQPLPIPIAPDAPAGAFSFSWFCR